MLTRTVTYNNFDNEPVQKVLHFNLTKMQLMDMEVHPEEGKDKLSDRINAIKQATKLEDVMGVFEDLLKTSYGIRTKDEDGEDYFDQDPKHWEKFRKSPAYDELFWSVFTNEGESAKFINELIPDLSGILKAADKAGRPVPQDFRKAVTQHAESRGRVVSDGPLPSDDAGTVENTASGDAFPGRNTFEGGGSVPDGIGTLAGQGVDLNSLTPEQLTEWVAKNQQPNTN